MEVKLQILLTGVYDNSLIGFKWENCILDKSILLYVCVQFLQNSVHCITDLYLIYHNYCLYIDTVVCYYNDI